MPMVSVIMAAYNHQQFINDAIESVLHQSFGDFELCITDDGSTDATPDLIAAIKDERLRFERFPANRGVSSALNHALSRATGDYIAVLNSDDIFLPEKLKTQVGYLRRHSQIAAVFGYPEFINEHTHPIPADRTFYGNVFRVGNRSRHAWLRHFFFAGNCLCHPSAMIRRDAHEVAGSYDVRLAQVHDLDLWIRIVQRYEIVIIPETCVLFRIAEGQRNASAPTPTVTTRSQWELAKVLGRYCDMDESLFLRSFEHDLESLPIAKSSSRASQLAVMALGIGTVSSVLFGLDQLYASIPMRDDIEADGSHVPARELISLTGQFDLFGFSRNTPQVSLPVK